MMGLQKGQAQACDAEPANARAEGCNACVARVAREGHPGSTVSGRMPAQKGAPHAATGGPQGAPWIDGERANARAEGDPCSFPKTRSYWSATAAKRSFCATGAARGTR